MSHSVAGEPSPAERRTGPLSTVIFAPAEWRLLVRLPGQVVVAASSAGPDRPAEMVAESLAGLEGIAAGRSFDSDLVRAVVAAVYAETVAPQPLADLGDPVRRAAATLADCRHAVLVLGDPTDPADSAAYRQWLQSVAVRVCRAGDPAGSGSPGEHRAGFLRELRLALDLGGP
ncbi:hypothetical protein [Plantactinospora sp. GCM10030261]|uniref:hypothetical protein n=1 Tax=Plantactinospora sp. GCM10030261 TaxID=3273420 RepID=UPI0036177D13